MPDTGVVRQRRICPRSRTCLQLVDGGPVIRFGERDRRLVRQEPGVRALRVPVCNTRFQPARGGLARSDAVSAWSWAGLTDGEGRPPAAAKVVVWPGVGVFSPGQAVADVPQLEDIEFIPCTGRLADRRVLVAAATVGRSPEQAGEHPK